MSAGDVWLCLSHSVGESVILCVLSTLMHLFYIIFYGADVHIKSMAPTGGDCALPTGKESDQYCPR